jgi:hypothetical protein
VAVVLLQFLVELELGNTFGILTFLTGLSSMISPISAAWSRVTQIPDGAGSARVV